MAAALLRSHAAVASSSGRGNAEAVGRTQQQAQRCHWGWVPAGSNKHQGDRYGQHHTIVYASSASDATFPATRHGKAASVHGVRNPQPLLASSTISHVDLAGAVQGYHSNGHSRKPFSLAYVPTQPSKRSPLADSDNESTVDLLGEILRPFSSTSYASSPKSLNGSSPRLSAQVDLFKQAASMEAGEMAQLCANLGRSGDLHGALRVLEAAVKAHRYDVLKRISHKHFLQPALQQKAVTEALNFIHLLPRRYTDARTYNMAINVCAAACDLRSALSLIDVMQRRNISPDYKIYTTLIKVCGSSGNSEQALRFFQYLRTSGQKLDGKVYGSMISAIANAMQHDGKERKEQLVLLERAFDLVDKATELSIPLEAPVWNSLVACAGRAGQLQRAFQALDTMQLRGIFPNAVTYGTLIAACTICSEPNIAMKAYRRALSEGFNTSVQIYSAAINACMDQDSLEFDTALEIYATMQRHHVEPDDRLYGALIALAGKTGNLEGAFALVNDMQVGGCRPSTATCSALIFACLRNTDLGAARKAYDILSQSGCYPNIAQYNALMEAYAIRSHLGDVVALLQDMTSKAKLLANVNTYRILLIACQRSDQVELAFELLHIMKTSKIIPKESAAQSICYTALKMCFNRIRYSWCPEGYPPKDPTHTGPFSSYLGCRSAESEKMLEALTGSRSLKHPGFAHGSNDCNWTALAVSVYRDSLANGLEPCLNVLDMLLACLRLPLDTHNAGNDTESIHLEPQFQYMQDVHRESAMASQKNRKFEVRFDRRAIALVEEAISMKMLPPVRLDCPFTLDMRRVPPNLAEVYVLCVLHAIEQKAAASPVRNPFMHPVAFLVPAFDANLINWPHYLEKDYRYYDLTNTEEPDCLSNVQTQNGSCLEAAEDYTAQGMSIDHDSDSCDDETAEFWGAHNAAEQDRRFSGSDVSTSSWETWEEESAHVFAIKGSVNASHSTGLAVAATFRRLKVFALMNPDNGQLKIIPRELNRWAQLRTHTQQSVTDSPPNRGMRVRSIAEQQRNIRMGVSETMTRSFPINGFSDKKTVLNGNNTNAGPNVTDQSLVRPLRSYY